MERRGNYFIPNNGQIGFSPLHMLGLSAIHPKSMQHGFVDVSVNTHTADNNFSLFKCKGQDSEIANMRNNLMDTFGCGLPVGNSFSKFIGGFIGSKCLIGSSTGRENNFWGRVLQQYNNIIGANNNIYISMSAVNTKENAGEYMKAGIVDAALLFSQNFDLFSTNNLISQDQTMGTTTKVSPQESSSSSMEMHLQGGVTAEPKQSYAEVTKSRVASKSSCSAASDRSSMCSKRLRSVRRYPRKQGQKEHSIHISPNNNWKYRTHRDDSAKHMDNTNYIREHRRKRCSVSRDNQQKTVASANSLKGTGTPHTSEDQKMNDLRTNNVQHSASRPNKKMPGKRKLNSNLLSDIKEDCLDVYDYLMACEKIGPFKDKFSHPPTKKWTPPTDQRSSNYCANWRCRPYSLCDPCKIKESYGNSVTDGDGSYTQQKTVTFETEQRENVKENNVPETPVIPLSLEKADDSSAKPISCSDSSLTECERFVSTMCPVTRRRISSECSVDSEDSFVIVFEASGDDPYEETSSETESVCSDSDSSDDDDTSSINSQCLTYKEHSNHHDDCNFDYDDDDDEIDFDDDDDNDDDDDDDPYISKAELEEANARWKSAYEDIQSAEKEPEKIHFDDNYYCYENDDDYDGGGGGGGGGGDGDDDDAEIKVVNYISKSELEEANARWESAYEDTQSAEKEPEKVQFAESPKLTTVHKIIAWDFAYRAARLGPWGAMALDRSRFHRRIQHMNRILSPVLEGQHRRKIWQKFHKETLNVP